MNLYALLFLSFIPLIAVLLIFLILIPGQKLRYCLWSCVIGLFTVLPTAFIQYYVLNLPIFNSNTVISLLITTIIFNGLIEETLKMLFMEFLPSKKVTISVFFTCGLLCGLTLGCFESVIYFVNRIQNSSIPMELSQIYNLFLSRMFTSVLIHTFCAGLSSLYLWMFKHKSNHLMPFIYAVLLHGIYNFFAGFKSNYYWFAIVAILFSILECRIWYKYITLPDSGVDIKRN